MRDLAAFLNKTLLHNCPDGWYVVFVHRLDEGMISFTLKADRPRANKSQSLQVEHKNKHLSLCMIDGFGVDARMRCCTWFPSAAEDPRR